MNRKALYVALAVAFVIGAPLAYSSLSNSLNLRNTGTLKTINVAAYWDSACTSQVTSVDWGTVEPGSTKNVDIYLKNTGNAPITLSLSVSNWSPSNASNYVSLSWNYSGQQISPGSVVQVTLTLTVSSNVSGISSFSFDMTIVGTG